MLSQNFFIRCRFSFIVPCIKEVKLLRLSYCLKLSDPFQAWPWSAPSATTARPGSATAGSAWTLTHGRFIECL